MPLELLHEAEKWPDRNCGQNEWDSETQRIDEEQLDPDPKTGFACRKCQNSCQYRTDAWGPSERESEPHDVGACEARLGCRRRVTGFPIEEMNLQDTEEMQAK